MSLSDMMGFRKHMLHWFIILIDSINSLIVMPSSLSKFRCLCLIPTDNYTTDTMILGSSEVAADVNALEGEETTH